jgi:hypothetical protein
MFDQQGRGALWFRKQAQDPLGMYRKVKKMAKEKTSRKLLKSLGKHA